MMMEWKDNSLYLLASLLKASKYIERDVVHTRLPIQCGLLRVIVDRVDNYFNRKSQPFLAKLFKAMMMMAYYGLLRIG